MTPQEITSICAITISVISLSSFIWFSVQARRHNRNSVLPYPHIGMSDYADQIEVTIENKGPGLMIIKKMEIINEKNIVVGDSSLIKAAGMPKIVYDDFRIAHKERALKSGTTLTLLKASENKNTDSWSELCLEQKEILGKLTIRLFYTDVYGTDFEPKIRSLKWFTRNAKG